MHKYYFIILILLGLVFAQQHVLVEYAANPNHSKIFITWKVSNETNIKQFDVLRSNDNIHFSRFSSIKANGSLEYTLYDGAIGKPTQTYFYKIRVIDKNNLVMEESESFFADANFSGIKATWGALKAMFR